MSSLLVKSARGRAADDFRFAAKVVDSVMDGDGSHRDYPAIMAGLMQSMALHYIAGFIIDISGSLEVIAESAINADSEKQVLS